MIFVTLIIGVVFGVLFTRLYYALRHYRAEKVKKGVPPSLPPKACNMYTAGTTTNMNCINCGKPKWNHL